jgi:hypothetical protein
MKFYRWLTLLAFSGILVAAVDAVAASRNGARQIPAAQNSFGPDRPALPEEDEVISNPTRPNWDASASTTQPKIMEIDSGWLAQAMGPGVGQEMLMSSIRYGVTANFDLRWGVTGLMSQNDDGPDALQGSGDQWFSARYRVLSQTAKLPSLAFLYAIKVPTANPAKGFGTGFYDHQFTFVASRDLGENHFDFNVVGTVVGESGGHDGSAQFGLALTRPLVKKLSWVLESYGGPQPGTSDRFGAAFIGAAYTLRPTMVVDIAYARTYTAGSPRAQFMFGATYAIRRNALRMPAATAMNRLLRR